MHIFWNNLEVLKYTTSVTRLWTSVLWFGSQAQYPPDSHTVHNIQYICCSIVKQYSSKSGRVRRLGYHTIPEKNKSIHHLCTVSLSDQPLVDWFPVITTSIWHHCSRKQAKRRHRSTQTHTHNATHTNTRPPDCIEVGESSSHAVREKSICGRGDINRLWQSLKRHRIWTGCEVGRPARDIRKDSTQLNVSTAVTHNSPKGYGERGRQKGGK